MRDRNRPSWRRASRNHMHADSLHADSLLRETSNWRAAREKWTRGVPRTPLHACCTSTHIVYIVPVTASGSRGQRPPRIPSPTLLRSLSRLRTTHAACRTKKESWIRLSSASSCPSLLLPLPPPLSVLLPVTATVLRRRRLPSFLPPFPPSCDASPVNPQYGYLSRPHLPNA